MLRWNRRRRNLGEARCSMMCNKLEFPLQHHHRVPQDPAEYTSEYDVDARVVVEAVEWHISITICLEDLELGRGRKISVCERERDVEFVGPAGGVARVVSPGENELARRQRRVIIGVGRNGDDL
jgi:hypothetical protein